MSALTDDELVELTELVSEADRVELKLTVPESSERSAANALGMDPLEAQIRQVFFFDTPELQLSGAGVVVRARRIAGKGDDSVIKLRPVIPDELPARLRRLDGFGVEVDATPDGFVCSASLKRRLGRPRAKDVGAGDLPIRKLFSKEQRALYEDHAPAGLALDHLRVLGPIFVLKLRSAPKDLGRKLVAELWLYPDDSQVVELSTKCAPDEAFQVAAEMRAFLTSVGIHVSEDQQTKTRKALDYFSARL